MQFTIDGTAAVAEVGNCYLECGRAMHFDQ